MIAHATPGHEPTLSEGPSADILAVLREAIDAVLAAESRSLTHDPTRLRSVHIELELRRGRVTDSVVWLERRKTLSKTSAG